MEVLLDSPPINDTRIRRLVTLLAIKALRRVRPHRGPVLLLTNNLCVKYGPLQRLSEAATMRFVSRHTNLPVPKIYCSFVHRDSVYIVMERIRGDPLCESWSRRTATSRQNILRQLKEMISELRSVSPENGSVATVEGGPLHDPRMPVDLSPMGPFTSVQQFHMHLRRGIESSPQNNAELNEFISLQNSVPPRTRLTHADLSSFNILVHGDDVVGIVDWESAGWYPAYWEYTCAWRVNPHNMFWQGEVGRFLEPYPQELAMEQLRLKYFGDF